MIVTDAGLRFPVLGISADNDLWGFRDMRALTTCGPLTLRDKMQMGMELIDADLRRWRVQEVRRLGPAGSILRRVIDSLLAGKPQSQIEQELEVLPALSLQEVQARVCSAMEAHPEFWSEEDEPGVLREQIAAVRSANNIEEIHDLLGLDTFEAY